MTYEIMGILHHTAEDAADAYYQEFMTASGLNDFSDVEKMLDESTDADLIAQLVSGWGPLPDCLDTLDIECAAARFRETIETYRSAIEGAFVCGQESFNDLWNVSPIDWAIDTFEDCGDLDGLSFGATVDHSWTPLHDDALELYCEKFRAGWSAEWSDLAKQQEATCIYN